MKNSRQLSQIQLRHIPNPLIAKNFVWPKTGVNRTVSLEETFQMWRNVLPESATGPFPRRQNWTTVCLRIRRTTSIQTPAWKPRRENIENPGEQTCVRLSSTFNGHNSRVCNLSFNQAIYTVTPCAYGGIAYFRCVAHFPN